MKNVCYTLLLLMSLESSSSDLATWFFNTYQVTTFSISNWWFLWLYCFFFWVSWPITGFQSLFYFISLIPRLVVHPSNKFTFFCLGSDDKLEKNFRCSCYAELSICTSVWSHFLNDMVVISGLLNARLGFSLLFLSFFF